MYVDRIHIGINKRDCRIHRHGFKLNGEFLRIPNVVGVKKSNPFSAGAHDAQISGRCSTAVFLTVIGDTVEEWTDDFLCLINGAVVYDDDFKISKRLTECAPNCVTDEALAVKHGDHDADLR